MHLEEFDRLRENAHSSGVMFYYSGYISQTIIAAMGEVLRLKVEINLANRSASRKLFSSFVEMAQNVVHYSADHLTEDLATDQELRYGALAIGRMGDKFFIVCGNLIQNEAVPALRERLENLRNMTLDEIKQAYRKQMREEVDEGSKGAGLGFLTVARDASEPIEYSFVPPTDSHHPLSFFYIKAII